MFQILDSLAESGEGREKRESLPPQLMDVGQQGERCERQHRLSRLHYRFFSLLFGVRRPSSDVVGRRWPSPYLHQPNDPCDGKQGRNLFSSFCQIHPFGLLEEKEKEKEKESPQIKIETLIGWNRRVLCLYNFVSPFFLSLAPF